MPLLMPLGYFFELRHCIDYGHYFLFILYYYHFLVIDITITIFLRANISLDKYIVSFRHFSPATASLRHWYIDIIITYAFFIIAIIVIILIDIIINIFDIFFIAITLSSII